MHNLQCRVHHWKNGYGSFHLHSMRFWKFMPGGSCLEKLFYVGPLNDKPNAEVIIAFHEKHQKERADKTGPSFLEIASTKLMKPHRRLRHSAPKEPRVKQTSHERQIALLETSATSSATSSG